MLYLVDRIPTDKLRHYLVGTLLAALGGVHSVLAGALLCAFFALAKEVRDRVTRRGTPELADLLWTLAGGAVALVPLAAWRIGGA